MNGSYVDGCYNKASFFGSEYFALKAGGTCWTSQPHRALFSAQPFMHPGDNCESGIGGKDHMFLYKNRKFADIAKLSIISIKVVIKKLTKFIEH